MCSVGYPTRLQIVIQLAWAANSRWLGSATLGWRCISTVQLPEKIGSDSKGGYNK